MLCARRTQLTAWWFFDKTNLNARLAGRRFTCALQKARAPFSGLKTVPWLSKIA
jgi:hypothetical protein